MAGFEIDFDERRWFLLCRIAKPLCADEVALLCAGLRAAWTAARAFGPVRLLWDHRGLDVLPDASADELLSMAFASYEPGDRAAILVSSSLTKVRGKHKMAEWAAFFMSENAADTWLNVGRAPVRPVRAA